MLAGTYTCKLQYIPTPPPALLWITHYSTCVLSYTRSQSLVASRWPFVVPSQTSVCAEPRPTSPSFFSTKTYSHSCPSPLFLSTPTLPPVHPPVCLCPSHPPTFPPSQIAVSMTGSKKKSKLPPRSKAPAPPSPAVSTVHASGESSLPAGEPNLHVHRAPPPPGPIDEPSNSSSSVASSSVSPQSSETKQRGRSNLSANDVEVRMMLLSPAASCYRYRTKLLKIPEAINFTVVLTDWYLASNRQ